MSHSGSCTLRHSWNAYIRLDSLHSHSHAEAGPQALHSHLHSHFIHTHLYRTSTIVLTTPSSCEEAINPLNLENQLLWCAYINMVQSLTSCLRYKLIRFMPIVKLDNGKVQLSWMDPIHRALKRFDACPRLKANSGVSTALDGYHTHFALDTW